MGNRTAIAPLRKRRKARKVAVKRPPWRPREPSATPFARWLDASRYTVAELAKELGSSTGNVYNLRHGRTTPGRRKAAMIEELSDGLVPVSSWDK